MSKFILIILLILSLTTHSQNPVDLKQVNNIEIHFFKGKQPSIYKTHRKIDLQYLKDLIIKAKNQTDLVCDTTGEIIYFKNKTVVFKAYFSSRGSGSKKNSVLFQNNNVKTTAFLNYGSGMLIDEVYYQAQK